MRVLRFHAANVPDAMALVRSDLGAEALILSTRRHGSGVEIIAAVDEHDDISPPPLRRPSSPPLPARPGGESGAACNPRLPRQTDEGDRATMLTWHGVPRHLSARLQAGPLPFALSLALRFSSLPLGEGPAGGARRLILVGPPGAGKTLTVARLATRLVLSGVRPVVVSTDAQRAGANEQLAALMGVLGLALRTADAPESLARVLARLPSSGPVLIDTAGLDPFAEADVAFARDLAGAAGGELVAVLAAGADPDECADMASSLAGAGAQFLVSARLDLARRLGGVLAAASVLALAEIGLSANVADGLAPASPAALARRLTLPRKETRL